MKKAVFLSFIMATTAILAVFAQTVEEDSVINRNITIEREYRPVIQDAGKINTQPQMLEPNVTRMTPQYTTDFSKPLQVEHNIHYLNAAELMYPSKNNKEGMARIGLGSGFNSLANFAYPLIKKPDMRLDFMLDHYGLFNRKAHSGTQAAMTFGKKFRTLDLYTGIGGSHEYYKYYGTIDSIDFSDPAAPKRITRPVDEIPSLDALWRDNHQWRANAHIGIRTLPANQTLRYAAEANYDLFHSRQGITEHTARFNANVDGEVGGNRLGLDFESRNLFYQNARPAATFSNHYILSLNPYYSFEKDAFDLRLGFRADLSLGWSGKQVFFPSPDIRFEWRAVPRMLSIYAGIGGKYQPNTLGDIYRENCFLNPDLQPADTYTPFDFYAGMKIKPVAGLLIDAYVDYQYTFNQYFFVNQGIGNASVSATEPNDRPAYYINRFNLTYSDAGLLKAGARISYNYHNTVSIRLHGAYNHWNVKQLDYAWYKPAFELDLNTQVRITRKLSAYANMDVEGGRFASVGNLCVGLDPKIDINLGASYALLEQLSVFVKINNLINNKYEQWYGYEVQGFNIMAGASFNF